MYNKGPMVSTMLPKFCINQWAKISFFFPCTHSIQYSKTDSCRNISFTMVYYTLCIATHTSIISSTYHSSIFLYKQKCVITVYTERKKT